MSNDTKPNYRIYDRTGGGVTEDITAESPEDAIERGREWIEGGDWSSDREDQDGGKTYRTIALDCCLREIVHVPDLRSITSLPSVLDASVLPDGSVRVECGPETVLTALPGRVIDGSQADADGYYDVVLGDVRLPLMIDEDATASGQSYDCSGKYSDTLPECEADDGGEHEWQADYDVVGGIRENPGVWSLGGTAMSFATCCAKCGCYRQEHSPGCQRNPDEPLETITIKPRDEKSEAWLKEKHMEDGWIPEWLALFLDCAPTMRMTEAQAREYVAGHDDSDTLDDDDLEHAFAALYNRRPDDEDRREGLWSHLCAAVQ
jgi:hypothetical protein